ncbi:MAG: hypothetical protein AB7V04_00435 [Desulfomonilaceae bacterium]
MSFRESYDIDDLGTHFVVIRNGQVNEIHPGRIYRIEPLNKNRKKNVGRKCMITALPTEFMSSEARVRFMDNLREGKVDIRELVEDK